MKHLPRLPQHLIYYFLAVLVAFNFIYAQSTASEKPLKENVSELEEKVRDLQAENDVLAHEIARLHRSVENLVGQSSAVQGKRVVIAKVKRVYQGRPKKNDMMVGVTQLMAVWDQFDYILDKLDELSAYVSQQ